MKPIRKMALVVMTLSIAAVAGQVVQGNASQISTGPVDAGRRAVLARVEPGALPQFPALEASLPAQKITLVAYVPADAPETGAHLGLPR